MSVIKEVAYLIGYGIATGKELVNTAVVSSDGLPAQCPKKQSEAQARKAKNENEEPISKAPVKDDNVNGN